MNAILFKALLIGYSRLQSRELERMERDAALKKELKEQEEYSRQLGSRSRRLAEKVF